MLLPKSWTDQRIEVTVGHLLRTGVMLSAAVVLTGAGIFLYRHGTSRVDYRVFQGEPADLRSVGGILRFAAGFHGRGIIQLGLLLLIATPVARVAFSIFGFAEEKDYWYVGFTSIVFAILLYSLFASA